MTPSKLVLREVARRDVSEAIGYYVREATHDVALGFIDDLERAFPYLVFHMPREDHVDVWRVLHGERDIPAWMQG